MDQQDEDESRAARPDRRWQFGLVHLLALPVALGLALGFFIAFYPYSLVMLPISLLVLVGAVVPAVCGLVRYSVAEAVVVSLVFYVLLTIVAPGCVDGREAARRSQCCNNLKQITLALHNYYDRYGSFPPAYVADEDGQPMHSWRVLILPFVEREDLYRQYRFDEPWNGPNNSRLASARISTYYCPEQDDARASGCTSYLALVGPEAAWPGATASRMEDIRDGMSDTLLVVEVAHSGIHWMEPRDLEVSSMALSVNPTSGAGISSLHCTSDWRPKRLGANAAFADGHVRFLPTGAREKTIRALVTAASGDAVARDEQADIQF